MGNTWLCQSFAILQEKFDCCRIQELEDDHIQSIWVIMKQIAGSNMQKIKQTKFVIKSQVQQIHMKAKH